jgi:hypothetical protein
MTSFSVSSSDVARCSNSISIVRPASNFIVINIKPECVMLHSSDRRRTSYSRIFIPTNIESESEFILPYERRGILDSKLSKSVFSISPSHMIIKSSGDDQNKKVQIKKRSLSSKNILAKFPEFDIDFSISKKTLDECLRQASCSALIKETKSEDDMRLNQIRMISSGNIFYSFARFYASVVHSDSPISDGSIISSDIPIVRSFLSKIDSDNVHVGQDPSNVYFASSDLNFALSLSKSPFRPHPFDPVDNSLFSSNVKVSTDLLLSSLDWSLKAAESGQRITLDSHDSSLKFIQSRDELSSIPIISSYGNPISMDFPSSVLKSIVGFVGSKSTDLFFDHSQSKTILCIPGISTANVKSFHYLQSMKPRSLWIKFFLIR